MTALSLFRDLIDLRSFSSLWYWLAVAAVWSHGNYFILGVPLDMIQRAGRDPAAMADAEALFSLRARRMLAMAEEGGAALVGFVAFVLVSLVLLGFWYRFEFAQAVSLILLPLTLVEMMRLALTRRLVAEGTSGSALMRALQVHRRWVQGVGALALLATALWGMSHSLTLVR